MMKRPRSFIATLLALLCLALAPVAGLVIPATAAHAALTTRLMNPRAGDPNEPDDGANPLDSGGGAYSPNDPSAFVEPAPEIRATAIGLLGRGWNQLIVLYFSLFLPWGR